MTGTDRLIVITGGPGSGKSTLVAALAARGFHCMPEAGRAIIQDQVAIGGDALPWADRAKFAELMLAWDMRSYRDAAGLSGQVVFDRGIPDVIGYIALSGLEVGPHFEAAARTFRYRRQVFIAPPWPEIYERDAERRQSQDEAEATYRALDAAYRGLGYEPIALPRTSVAARVDFIVREIAR
ncbi:AAA family ATPase [Hyphomicrobium sp. NDB2Meth4]|uniref:AAA family ATPase n=1 Tax=Hyphomicrobium sp. NDB2Meth4 TaxID=1892846 RepID=UPI000AA56F26|nr:AAA family ATPase [Hyphomicrobium sp. NDB2Meth4]